MIFFPLAEVGIITDRQSPSISAHKITFSLKKTKPLTLQFPWPFLADQGDIETSIVVRGKNNKILHIVLKKSLSDLWPIEFDINRRKWDVENLPSFKNYENNGTLEDHIDAQFDCTLLMAPSFSPIVADDSIYPLQDLRNIMNYIYFVIQTCPVGSIAIYSPEDDKDAAFKLLVHLPIRFTPQGVPLLLVSAIDLQLSKELVEQGRLGDDRQFKLDYERIIGRNCKSIRFNASLTETIRLLRYLLRLNSTKIKPSNWQLENLPLKGNNLWMASFLSPLYAEFIADNCGEIKSKMLQESKSVPIQKTEESSNSRPLFCAGCLVGNCNLKFCSRCESVFYCSVECQKKDWKNHKPQCLRKNQTASN